MTRSAASPDKPYRLTLRAILRDEQGRVLIMRRNPKSLNQPGRWEFPGGKGDEGENVSEALRREVKEETGLDVTLDRVIGHAEWEDANHRIAYLIFDTTITGGSFAISEEHVAAEWVEPARLESYDLSPQLAGTARALAG